MTFVAHYLAEPLTDLPARRPETIRRTSRVDMIGHDDGTLELVGAAADPGGTATCRAIVDPGGNVVSLMVDPVVGGSMSLVGRPVRRGFRDAVDPLCEPGTLPSVLLRELPVAALLSGYAHLYTGRFVSPIPDAVLAGFPVDICAGWAAPASFMVQIRSTKEMPTPSGPISPDLETWDDLPALAPGSMRRQRLIERTGLDVWAMFRDTYARPDGHVTILHEYSVAATLTNDEDDADGGGLRVAACQATPRVLPWAECPSAAASAQRVVGHRVDELRALVRDDFTGTSTCTHLNDLLASLGQADHLV